ncbi:MAG TPA: DUF937 domain-containing protein [Saprospiraceae bacterium]|nr:DUF937 domain-containing protein [Saprospiraceae bacterium]
MFNLVDLIQSQLSPDTVDQIDKQIGVGNKEQTAVAMQSAISTLISAMAQNAKKPQGAQSLSSALDKDHDGSILNDMMGFLGGQKKANNPNMLNGSGILGHILGNKQEEVARNISKQSGLDQQKVMSLLITLAPVVMGFLGKAKKDGNLNPQTLSTLLNTASALMGKGQKSKGGADLLSTLLGGGQKKQTASQQDMIGDAARSLLGKFFKK